MIKKKKLLDHTVILSHMNVDLSALLIFSLFLLLFSPQCVKKDVLE